MNSDLHHVKQSIINSTNPAVLLEIIDGYIDLYNRSRANFILPAPHANLQVVIDACAHDGMEFRNFIREVRDSIDDSRVVDVHRFYRKVNTRVSQRILRERKNIAIKKIQEHLNLEFTSGQWDAVYVWITQYWAKNREDFLALHRAAEPGRRLSSDQRTELSEEFWEKVDTDLSNNIFPIPPEVVYGKLASLESYKPDSI